jgi:hypothetical protein
MIVDNFLNSFAVQDGRKCMHILPSKPLFLLEKFLKKERAN